MKVKPALTKQEIKELLIAERLTLKDVVDAVIEINGLIGVGLISFGDDLYNYVSAHHGDDIYVHGSTDDEDQS